MLSVCPLCDKSKVCCIKLPKSVSDVCESSTVICVELEVTVSTELSYFFTCDLCITHFSEPARHIILIWDILKICVSSYASCKRGNITCSILP